jgi:hypothetical protein
MAILVERSRATQWSMTAGIAALVCAAGCMFTSSTVRTEHPFAFSHRSHAAHVANECSDCHNGAEDTESRARRARRNVSCATPRSTEEAA